MKCRSRFAEFISAISPTKSQREQMALAHQELRAKLEEDKGVKPNLVSTFIQGSYSRFTGLIGSPENHCDVDVVVVTKIPTKVKSSQALDLFIPFLEKHYKGRYKRQARSWGIKYSDIIDLDMVPTSAPSESWEKFLVEQKRLNPKGEFDFSDIDFEASADKAPKNLIVEAFKSIAGEKWQKEPLLIPDRLQEQWSRTHPIRQSEWTTSMNARCGGYYTNTVRAVKWLKRTKIVDPKYPKGYPLEHIVGVTCKDGMTSIAEGVVTALENLVANFCDESRIPKKPYLADHGVPEHDVLKRISNDEFGAYYNQAGKLAKLARDAFDDQDDASSARKWFALFGPPFPPPPEDGGDGGGSGPGGFTARTAPSTFVQPKRFA
jgi:Second Messenger Oligonucleotide or Dinucleotide Synthetase domain